MVLLHGFSPVTVFDVSERIVKKDLKPGSYEIDWYARSGAISSGVYFYVLRSGGYVDSKRMILIK